jgi:MFS transporter, SP family, solute carrier family 2 (myo-inositol transporter), member 13
MVACACYTMGSVALSLATGFGSLLVGRLLLGLGVGLSSIAIPVIVIYVAVVSLLSRSVVLRQVYLAEMSPPVFRGRIVSSYTLSIVAGQALSCVVNIVCDRFLGASLKWRVSLGAAAVPAMVQLGGFCFGLLPESPKWLAAQGRAQEAKGVLAFLRGARWDAAAKEVADADGDRRSEEEGGGAGGSERSAEPLVGSLLAEDWRALEAMPVEDVGDVRSLVAEVCARPHLRRIFTLGVGLQVKNTRT